MELIIRPRMIERAAFTLVIIVLAVLLAFVSLRTPTCAAPVVTNDSGTQATAPNATHETSPPDATPAATCSDGLKNQDETSIDCGGLVCASCGEGLSCKKNSDCLKGRCDATQACNATLPAAASDFTIVNVNYNGSLSTTADVTGVAITVKNGKTTTGRFRIEFYVKSSDNKYYLNQGGKDLVSEPKTTYAKVTLAAIDAGGSLTQVIDLAGTYTGTKGLIPTIAADNGFTYDAGQDFIVEGKLIDADSGATIKVAQKKVIIK